ncbi:MAG: hypothetical protein JWR60_1784 [Polaromonas sp.]|nr:hypothetical protein [Polaromonas sp.]
MATFIQIEYAASHPGLGRIGTALRAVRQLASTRGLAMLLLSALAGAGAVAAHEVLDSLAEGHLLMLWLALWMVLFVALALFSRSAGHLARKLNQLSLAVAKNRLDWAMPLSGDKRG